MHLWPRAYATATDIDPIAIDVTAENAETNGVPLGLGIGRLALTVADGTANALVLRRARYDLIVANILAGPLIDMAADVAAIAAPGGQLVLARSEERRVGKECGSTFRFRWAPYNSKKKKQIYN